MSVASTAANGAATDPPSCPPSTRLSVVAIANLLNIPRHDLLLSPLQDGQAFQHAATHSSDEATAAAGDQQGQQHTPIKVLAFHTMSQLTANQRISHRPWSNSSSWTLPLRRPRNTPGSSRSKAKPVLALRRRRRRRRCPLPRPLPLRLSSSMDLSGFQRSSRSWEVTRPSSFTKLLESSYSSPSVRPIAPSRSSRRRRSKAMRSVC